MRENVIRLIGSKFACGVLGSVTACAIITHPAVIGSIHWCVLFIVRILGGEA